MKDLLVLLLILFIIGILWIWSGFWDFEEEQYVNDQYLEQSMYVDLKVDLEFLKREFEPAL